MTQYDAFAADYVRLQREGKSHDPTRKILRELIPTPLRGAWVLDAGCGPGIDAAWMAAQGAKVTAIDDSVEMIRAARERFPGLEPLRRDLTRTGFASNLYDGVFTRYAIDYAEDLDGAFGELHRVLKPGGWLVLSADHPDLLKLLDRGDGKAACAFFEGNVKVTKPVHTFATYGRALSERFLIDRFLPGRDDDIALPPAATDDTYTHFCMRLYKLPLATDGERI